MKKKMNPKFLSAAVMSAVLIIQGQAAMAAEFSDGGSFGYTEAYSPFSSSDNAVWQEQAPAAVPTEEPLQEETGVFSEVAEEPEAAEDSDMESFPTEQPSSGDTETQTEESPVVEETFGDTAVFDAEEFQQEAYKTEFSYEDTEVLVSAKALEEAQLPLNTEMKVVKLVEGTPEYEEAKGAVEASCGADEKAEYVFYDVTFEIDGQEIQPADGMVCIQIEFKTIQKNENPGSQNVFHIDETETGNVVKDVTASTEAGNNVSSVNFAF